MSAHFWPEPQPWQAIEFREELLRVIPPTRTEAGCLAIRVFELLRQPSVFTIHSEWWTRRHFSCTRNCRTRFLGAAKELLTHPLQGLRTRDWGKARGADPPGTSHIPATGLRGLNLATALMVISETQLPEVQARRYPLL